MGLVPIYISIERFELLIISSAQAQQARHFSYSHIMEDATTILTPHANVSIVTAMSGNRMHLCTLYLYN